MMGPADGKLAATAPEPPAAPAAPAAPTAPAVSPAGATKADSGGVEAAAAGATTTTATREHSDDEEGDAGDEELKISEDDEEGEPPLPSSAAFAAARDSPAAAGASAAVKDFQQGAPTATPAPAAAPLLAPAAPPLTPAVPLLAPAAAPVISEVAPSATGSAEGRETIPATSATGVAEALAAGPSAAAAKPEVSRGKLHGTGGGESGGLTAVPAAFAPAPSDPAAEETPLSATPWLAGPPATLEELLRLFPPHLRETRPAAGGGGSDPADIVGGVAGDGQGEAGVSGSGGSADRTIDGGGAGSAGALAGSTAPAAPSAGSSAASKKASELKAEGNRLLAQGDLVGAVRCYSMAIGEEPHNHLLFSNRSAAYIKLRDFERALADAESCVRLRPEFVKGHGRRASALLAAGRLEDAIRAAELGMAAATLGASGGGAASGGSGAAGGVGSTVSALRATQNDAQATLLRRVLLGAWRGTVHPDLGGYDQVFAFTTAGRRAEDVGGCPPAADSLRVTVFGRETPGRFLIRGNAPAVAAAVAAPPAASASSLLPPVRRVPLALDVSAIATGLQADLCPPPVVSYIFRVERRPCAELPWEAYEGLTELSAAEIAAAQWRLVLCAPCMTLDRPTAFEGPGLIYMDRLADGEPTCARTILPELEALSVEEQIQRYCQELGSVHFDMTEGPLQESALMGEVEETASRNLARFMRYQAEIYGISQKYPDNVSHLAELMLLTVPPGAMEPADERRRSEEKAALAATFSAETRALLDATAAFLDRTGLNLVQLALDTPASPPPDASAPSPRISVAPLVAPLLRRASATPAAPTPGVRAGEAADAATTRGEAPAGSRAAPATAKAMGTASADVDAAEDGVPQLSIYTPRTLSRFRKVSLYAGGLTVVVAVSVAALWFVRTRRFTRLSGHKFFNL